MEVDFAILADSAQVVGGKLYVLGGAFDTINSKKAPIIHSAMSLAFRLLFDAGEVDRTHNLEIVILDEDGKQIAKAGGPLMVKRNPNKPAGWKQGFLGVLNFANLKFEKFGDYNLNIMFNNTSVKSITLRIHEKS